MDTLKRRLPFSGDEGLHELRKIAVRFEDKIHIAATSQIADGDVCCSMSPPIYVMLPRHLMCPAVFARYHAPLYVERSRPQYNNYQRQQPRQLQQPQQAYNAVNEEPYVGNYNGNRGGGGQGGVRGGRGRGWNKVVAVVVSTKVAGR